jgi:hypothetical protein
MNDSPMPINEVKCAKAAMEGMIMDAIKAFTKYTGLHVSGLSAETVEVCQNGRAEVHVSRVVTEVRL